MRAEDPVVRPLRGLLLLYLTYRVEILYRLQRRPRGGIFGRAEKFLFLAALRVLFVFRVCSERNAKKCAFGRRDSCRYSREPTFQSLNKG